MSACINQFDCATTSKGPVCVHGDVHACGADRQCSTTERCVDGLCVALTELCSDETQCPSSKLCVDGKCTSGCTTDPQCPAGFACRLALGVCNVASKPCALTNDCASKDLVCVDGACVPRCATRGSCADAAGTCVDNGCVPNQGVVVQCNGQGASADCQSGQVCLHHHCYVSCQSPNENACSTRPSTPLCKTVAVGGTSYSVCGTTTTLGSECDASAGKVCTGKTCIDGYCR